MDHQLTANVIKRFAAQGWTFCNDGNRYWARKPGNRNVVSFIDQFGDAMCLRVRCEDDHDDMQTDYSAGSYADSIKQAFRLTEIS